MSLFRRAVGKPEPKREPQANSSKTTSDGAESILKSTTSVSEHSIGFATEHFTPQQRTSSGESLVESAPAIVGRAAVTSIQSLRQFKMSLTSGDADDPKPSESKDKPSDTKDKPSELKDKPSDSKDENKETSSKQSAKNDKQAPTPKEASKESQSVKPEQPTEGSVELSLDGPAPEDSQGWSSWKWTPRVFRWQTEREGEDSGGSQDPASGAPGTPSEQENQQDQENQQEREDPPEFKDKGGAWAFWSRKKRASTEEGELAVSGTDTATQPRDVTVDAKAPKRRRSARPHLVIPSVMDAMEWPPSSARFMAPFARLGIWHNPVLYRAMPAQIHKVVVVGVHGYFPARVTRAILGEPTGTSIKFANEAAAEVERWAERQGRKVEIEKIALEGEGKIAHRIDTLYKLLLNWQTLIKQADFVFFALHSQGTVVGIQLVQKLIEDGHLRHQKVGILGMAATCLGPMPGMDQTLMMKAITKIENDSLRELFELQRADSPLSQALATAMDVVLKFGCKITLVGSADDQLVPLYSALYVNANHPNIIRAAYLDGEDVAPEVVAPLLGLAIAARNAGHSDHGVILEVSSALAGTITGKGHSKLYSCHQVYQLAVDVALETTNNYGQTPMIDESFKIPRNNPYLLPWAMHGLLADAVDRPTHHSIVQQLYDEFDQWRPDVRSLKDLKYRLSGMKRAKL